MIILDASVIVKWFSDTFFHRKTLYKERGFFQKEEKGKEGGIVT